MPGSARWVGFGLLSLLAFVAAVAYHSHRPAGAPQTPITARVPEEVRQAEDARLAGLGLAAPAGRLVLERPFSPPWTRRSLIVPGAWLRPDRAGQAPPAGHRRATVKASELLADLDVLEPVMALQYGGWATARARGFDWGQWFAGWRSQLREAGDGELSLDEAFEPVDRLLAFQRDNHTQIPLERRTSRGSQTLILDSPAGSNCTRVETADGQRVALDVSDPAQRTRRALARSRTHEGLVPVDVISMPWSGSPPLRAECNDRWVSLTRALLDDGTRVGRQASPAERSEAPGVERISPTAVRVRLPIFLGSVYDSQVEARRRAGAHPDGRETLIVLDLRDNGGGSVDLAYPILREWVDLRRLPTIAQMPVELNRSCLLYGLSWNLGIALGFNEGLDEPKRRQLQAELDLLAREPPGCPVEPMARSPSPWFFTGHAVRARGGHPRIIALVNGGCGSDCEGLVHLLAALPETVLVGANTCGVGQFVVPGYSVLPHTRLPFRMAMGHSNVYGDDRSFDGHGLDVDVVLRDQSEATDERLIELARWLDAATDAGAVP